MQKYTIDTVVNQDLEYGALPMTDELFENLPSWVKELFEGNHWDKYNSIFIFQYNYYGEMVPDLLGFMLFKQVVDEKGHYGAKVVSVCTNSCDETLFYKEIFETIISVTSVGTYWEYYRSHMMGYSFICFHKDDKEVLKPFIEKFEFENKHDVLYHYFTH